MATQKEQVVSARVTDSTKRKIARLAEEEKRPISNLVAILLEEALEGRKKGATA